MLRLFSGVLTSACLLVATAALAVTDDDLLDCRALPGESERLACYDGLAQQIQLARDAAGITASSQWRVTSQPASFTDGANVHMSVRATEPVVDAVAGRVYPELWVQCVEGETAAFVDWGFTIGGGSKDAIVRLDREPALTGRIEISNDYRAIGGWREQVVDFLKRLDGKRQLVFETSDLAARPLQATFPIQGFAEASKPLREACGW